MKRILSFALVLGLCLALLPFSTSAGWLSVETYYAIKATTEPVIDGQIDEIWEKANIAKVEKFGSNIYPDTSTAAAHEKNPVASAEMRVMWAEDCIYVLGVVNDPTPFTTVTSAGDENIDGIDIQLSEDNMEAGTMRDDTAGEGNEYPGNGIFNVNINGKVTGWGGVWFADNGQEKAEAAAVLTDIGYTFEARIPLQTTTGYTGKTIGLEFQINDNQKGAGRTAIRQWSCETCMAHSDTAYLGTCIFVDNPGDTLAPETDPPATFATEYIPPAPTDAPTDAPTAAPTDASTEAPETEAPAKSGCASSVGVGAIVVCALMTAPIMLKKRNED